MRAADDPRISDTGKVIDLMLSDRSELPRLTPQSTVVKGDKSVLSFGRGKTPNARIGLLLSSEPIAPS